MTIDEMLEVLQAAKRGEKIEVLKERFDPCEVPDHTDVWKPIVGPVLFNMPMDRYRIAPKKETTLVEELRHKACYVGNPSDVLCRAADRIELLELAAESMHLSRRTQEELINEVRRRMG